jgi:hypothetical protein
MFIMTTNAESSMPLIDSIRPFRDQIRFNLGQLDNHEDWSYQLWFVPDSAGWPDALQLHAHAVRAATRLHVPAVPVLVVVARRVEDGQLRHYVVGRPHDLTEPLTEAVNVAGTDHAVHPAEVFDADEATDLFFHYFGDSGTVPDGYVLRLLDLS